MRKIILNVLEMNKYEVIKKLVETNGSKKRAALKLRLSIRQVNRLIKIYITKGKAGFSHGNKGKVSQKSLKPEVKDLIVDLYKTKYQDANIKHFQELLKRYEKIDLSYTCIYSILRKAFVLSPKVHKQTVKFEKAKIMQMKKDKQKLSEGQNDLVVNNNILADYDAHSRIPRLKYFGECLETDASEDYWLENFKSTLHGAIDNSTGTVCGLYLDYQETLNGYYHLFERIWRKFGVPAKFKTDNRTVFVYAGLKQKSMDKDTLTQFGYACNQLGVELETTSIPEEKSRIERLWETLQSRLPIEFRLAGIKTIEEANKFLEEYIDKFNEQFALPIDYSTSVFEKVDFSLINTTLSIIDKRTFDKGCCIKYKNKWYLAYKNDKRMNYMKGTKCLVIQTFDNQLYCNVDDELSVLYELPEHEKISKDFDFTKEKKEMKGTYIPPLSHPWKRASYLRYLATIPRHEDSAYD